MCLALWAFRLWLRYVTLQNLIPSFPWIAPPRPPPWRNPRKGRDQILPSCNLGRTDGSTASGNCLCSWEPRIASRASLQVNGQCRRRLRHRLGTKRNIAVGRLWNKWIPWGEEERKGFLGYGVDISITLVYANSSEKLYLQSYIYELVSNKICSEISKKDVILLFS